MRDDFLSRRQEILRACAERCHKSYGIFTAEKVTVSLGATLGTSKSDSLAAFLSSISPEAFSSAKRWRAFRLATALLIAAATSTVIAVDQNFLSSVIETPAHWPASIGIVLFTLTIASSPKAAFAILFASVALSATLALQPPVDKAQSVSGLLAFCIVVSWITFVLHRKGRVSNALREASGLRDRLATQLIYHKKKTS